MCLGIPGQIIEITDLERKLATVDISGVRRVVNVACVTTNRSLDDLVGRWALIHVGFAMSLIDEAEAALTLRALHELDEISGELETITRTEAMMRTGAKTGQGPVQ
ncbi:HypC/HybG/HupF family hydrogenase formation chaperone [uncultured Cohaesibacter sp.]|uniref:HypC/HybG/HupF family hydrogenase formation chaperone n=1 Tax=uncultured Cohaesibacter sp. TaxID=1002546 RepID=UPI0029C75B7B|nr:HypC/HybG/HupF family hydrogenase formation chaperone [uncultured Cohaesibacter sp.]